MTSKWSESIKGRANNLPEKKKTVMKFVASTKEDLEWSSRSDAMSMEVLKIFGKSRQE